MVEEFQSDEISDQPPLDLAVAGTPTLPIFSTPRVLCLVAGCLAIDAKAANAAPNIVLRLSAFCTSPPPIKWRLQNEEY